MDETVYDEVVAGLYQAATGELDWVSALDPLCAVLRARVVTLESYDLPTKTLLALDSSVRDDELHRTGFDYVRKYNTINSRVPLLFSTPVGEWVHDREHLEDAHVAQDPFYQEYLIPYRISHASGMMVPINERNIIVFAAHWTYRESLGDEEKRHWLQRLGEHIRNACVAYERLRNLAAQALAGHQLLSCFPYPMWLLDADRHVFFANPAAQRESAEEGWTAMSGSRLRLRSRDNEQKLTQQLHGLLHAGGNEASTALDLRRTESDPPTWLHLSLMVPGQVLGAFGERPLILAILFDPHFVSSLDPFALANMFDLTPAEARVAVKIADGLSPDDIAAANGTQVSTVRFHLSNVLAKIGVERQADIVRVLRQGDVLWAMAQPARP